MSLCLVFHNNGWSKDIVAHPKLSPHGLTIQCILKSQDLKSTMHIRK